MERTSNITEEAPNLYRIAVPLWPRHPLGHVNVYLLRSDDGPVLVDCGPDTADAYATLVEACHALGLALTDIRRVFLTHTHPDHCGLLSRLRSDGTPQCFAHPAELTTPPSDEEAEADFVQWADRAGIPEAEHTAYHQVAQGFRRRACSPSAIDRPLTGQETFVWPPYIFRVFWVPGHAPGLLCLYEPVHGLLIASDHVLPETSPHVGSFPARSDRPLSSYLASLDRIRQLRVQRTLPGHGEPFGDARPRIEELLAHHQERLQEIRTALAAGPRTAYAVATELSWMGQRGSWSRLDPFQRFLALTETIAHLEHLVETGDVALEGRHFVATA
ncbi:MAG: MBL fold metallo-hydrolase [Thermomicrobium sp.]|nr:MBL fold metallo-hydrolase [Thermomicrobium sp.]